MIIIAIICDPYQTISSQTRLATSSHLRTLVSAFDPILNTKFDKAKFLRFIKHTIRHPQTLRFRLSASKWITWQDRMSWSQTLPSAVMSRKAFKSKVKSSGSQTKGSIFHPWQFAKERDYHWHVSTSGDRIYFKSNNKWFIGLLVVWNLWNRKYRSTKHFKLLTPSVNRQKICNHKDLAQRHNSTLELWPEHFPYGGKFQGIELLVDCQLL